MTPPIGITRPKHGHIAMKSALAAGLFLGMPAGLLFWLILLSRAGLVSPAHPFIPVLQAHALNKIIMLMIGSLGWSYWLGRVGGYGPWWKIALASVPGILAGWFSPLSNLDGWFADEMPTHTLYALAMSGIVASVTLCVGLAYGLILRNIRAAMTMALSTSTASVLALLLTIFLFDLFGIRVGGGVPFAMSKVTTASLLISAIAGGAALGVGFSRFVGEKLR